MKILMAIDGSRTGFGLATVQGLACLCERVIARGTELPEYCVLAKVSA